MKLVSYLSKSAANLLNLGVVIYLAWSGILFSTSLIFVSEAVVVNKLLVSGILFSTSLLFAFKTVVDTRPLVSSTLLSTSPIFLSKFSLPVLYWFMWIRVVASGFFFSKFNFVFSVFLTTPLSTKSLNVLIYQHLNHLLLILNYSN